MKRANPLLWAPVMPFYQSTQMGALRGSFFQPHRTEHFECANRKFSIPKPQTAPQPQIMTKTTLIRVPPVAFQQKANSSQITANQEEKLVYASYLRDNFFLEH